MSSWRNRVYSDTYRRPQSLGAGRSFHHHHQRQPKQNHNSTANNGQQTGQFRQQTNQFRSPPQHNNNGRRRNNTFHPQSAPLLHHHQQQQHYHQQNHRRGGGAGNRQFTRSLSLVDVNGDFNRLRHPIVYYRPSAPAAYTPPTYALYPYPPETDNGFLSEEEEDIQSEIDKRCEIFVGRLPVYTKQFQLIRVFGQYGAVERCTVRDGGWQAYAFIKFAEPSAAKRAVRTEHGQLMSGCPMHVEYAKNLRGEYHTFTHRLQPTGVSVNYCCNREHNHRPDCRWFNENRNNQQQQHHNYQHQPALQSNRPYNPRPNRRSAPPYALIPDFQAAGDSNDPNFSRWFARGNRRWSNY